jgi:RNA polymerase sigma-70 factor (ECF subfamily)
VDLSDPRQFEDAYKLHSARVRHAAQRVLCDAAAAEDVAQEVFVRLWQRPSLFDDRRGSLPAFLSVMARSRALDRLRAEGARDRARDRLGELHVLAAVPEEGPADAVLRHAEREELMDAVRRLPAAQRETVTLAYGAELNSAEIASRMNVGRATARSRLRLGLGKLRTELEQAA